MKKIAVLGYGGRGKVYAQRCSALQYKNDFDVVAVIDNNPEKIEVARRVLGLKDDQLFSSLDDFLAGPHIADILFICTQDRQHYGHAIAALDAGYNILLEKPVACSIEECEGIRKKAEEKGLNVNVCHVLRYSNYYRKIKEVMDSGVIGNIVAIEQVENVAYWHQAHSYVRGDWRRAEDSTPMILAKCCHDLDIAVYLAGSECESVTSMGKLNYFNKEHMPEGATKHCVDGCKYKDKCPYDAEKLYYDPIKYAINDKIIENCWPQTRLMSDGCVSRAKVKDAIAHGQFGECVFGLDNDVVDYQHTTMNFKNGIVSSLTMTAFSSGASYRETRIRGTLGEILGRTDSKYITLRVFGKKDKKIKYTNFPDAHGGGDAGIIKALAEGTLSTDVKMSIESHMIGFCAEKSRLNGGEVVKIDDYRKE